MTQKNTVGGFFGDSYIPKEYVNNVVQNVYKDLPSGTKLIANIGSAGFKSASHDIDLFVDADALMGNFKIDDQKLARRTLQQFMTSHGYKTRLSGRNVHIEAPYNTDTGEHTVQVDLMVISDAAIVAEWHQHGLRGMYNDPKFVGGHIFILISSIAKHLGLKFDQFSAKLIRRSDDVVIARTRDEVAKVLLHPNATANDLNSVATIINALANDPEKDGKLAQAKQDAINGTIVLPESV
jgi:hypothetical protein